MMTDSEIADAIMRRLYSGAFEPGVEPTLNLKDYAEELGIENQRIWEIYERLKERGLIKAHSLGGWVIITSGGILYCEENALADPQMARRQAEVRTRLLDAAARFRDEHSSRHMIHYTQLCRDAEVSEEEFGNNFQLLMDYHLLQTEVVGMFQITSYGMDRVLDYRLRVARKDTFDKLKALDGVTPQQRGHRLEDLIEDVAKNEDWSAETRVRSQGQEHDVVLHRGFDYFIISSKWESDPIEPKEVELLESRVRSRAGMTGGLLFSMSGFTDNCIEEARYKISSARILLFGPSDIEAVMQSQSSLTEMLDAKIEQAMKHRKILVDGEAK